MTEAQKRANRKYHTTKRDKWTLDAPKGLRALVDAAAAQDGCTRNAGLVALIRQELEGRGVDVEEACRLAKEKPEERQEGPAR